MEKEKLRSEIADKYKWDLSDIFKDGNEFLTEHQKIEDSLEEILKYENHIMDNADNLYQCLKLFYDISRKLECLNTYGTLLCDIDITNQEYQKYKGMADNLSVKFEELTAFINPEILRVPDSLLQEYLTLNPSLKNYEMSLYDITRLKKYTLDKDKEDLLTTFSFALSKLFDTYQILKCGELDFDFVSINGKKVQMSSAIYSKYKSDPDRKIRKKAFTSYLGSFAKFNNTMAANYDLRVSINNKISTTRGYANALEAALINDDLNIDIFNAVVNAVTSNISLKSKYNRIIKRKLGVKKLYQYDFEYEPLSSNKEYSYEEAIDVILKAFAVYGDDYIKQAEKIINDRCIDVYPCQNKVKDGYNWRNYEKPFILYNYNNKLTDVLGIAHEIGHAINSVKVKEANEYQNFHYSSFLAEIASLTNEIIVCDYIIKNSSEKSEKLCAVKKMIDLILLNIFTAIKRALFERDVHERSQENGVLTAEQLNDLCLDYNHKFAGDGIVIDDLSKYEWQLVTHFYYGFYNYQYALGLICAIKFANDIIENKKEVLENYLNFLSTGGSKPTLETLKIAGIDLTDSKIIGESIKYFEKLINEYEKIYFD